MENHILVVLGSYGVQAFNQLTGEAIRRLELAFWLWDSREYSHLLISGGIVTSNVAIQTKPEAVLMQEWLQIRLVADGRMIIEPHGITETESAIHAVRLLQDRVIHDANIMIVSNLPTALVCREIFLANGFKYVRCELVPGSEGAMPRLTARI